MKLGRLGVTIAGMLAVLWIASCSNSSGGGSPTTSTTTTTSASHSWYYTVTVTTGTQAYVSYCINSTGGQDSPGTVTAPWTSATYSSTLSSPQLLVVSAWLPTGVTGSITGSIYVDGKVVVTQTANGSGAYAYPSYTLEP